jgi:CheY-like chemotaxis protein
VGYPLPRILIADDNSNIQRMATLALKDAGIEVIAVGNGEAAVRKMSEVLPDLVLADIFMPVRNGYEVCEFVKRDPRYANIPVLLLAGAFDPFDEQEAQRVHADGVLKKPFVPPDPLINAVTALLAKSAGDRLMAVTVSVAAEASVESARTAAVPRVFEPPAGEAPYEEPEELAPPVSRLDSGASETAFAPPLESPAYEADEAETTVTASRDPSLGEPSFWVPTEETEEPAEAEETPAQDLTDHTWNSGSHAVPMREEAPLLEELELAPETDAQLDDLALAEPTPQDPVQESVAPAPLEAAPEPAPNYEPASSEDRSVDDTLPLPETWVESAPLEMAPLEDSVPSEPAASLPSAALPAQSPAPLSPLSEFPSSIPFLGDVPTTPAAPSTSAASPSEQAPSKDEIPTLELTEPETLLKWSEPLHALQEPEPETASREQVEKPEPQAAPQELDADLEPDFAIEWPPAFIPAISSGVSEIRTPSLQIVPAAHTAPAANEPEPAQVPAAVDLLKPTAALLGPKGASLSPESAEALVQRVIERMQPQIMEIVTRDILRPLVEALVQQELKG